MALGTQGPILAACFAFFLSLSAQAMTPVDASNQVQAVLHTMDHVPAAFLPESSNLPKIIFVRLDPEDPWSLGIVRVMRVKASGKLFQAVLDDIPAYVGLFKDLNVATRTPASVGGGFVLFTETEIPLPFVANDRTSVRYGTRKSGEYTLSDFSLVESNHLKSFEGAALMAPVGKGEVVYWKVTFIKVDYGAARVLPPKMFWVKNALGGLQADWALKLRAEETSLAPENALKQSEAFSHTQEDAVSAAFDNANSFDDFLKNLTPVTSAGHAFWPTTPWHGSRIGEL